MLLETIPTTLPKDLACLKCGASFIHEDAFECISCGQRYRSLHGIPLFVVDVDAYVAKMANLYFQFLQAKERELRALKKAFALKQGRNEFYMSLNHAIESNNDVLRQIMEKLCSEAKPMALLREKNTSNVPATLKDFHYLQRDWTWLQEGEHQVSIICSALDDVVMGLDDKESALLLGAGVGRIAVDQSKHFGTTYATDLSFSMCYFFNQLIKGKKITFHEINYNNIFKESDVSRELTATFEPYIKEKGANATKKLFYYISDVLRSPLKSNSLSTIYSIYFTDVLSPKLLVPEVYRLLKADGVFIHFGPLGYGFEDISEKLAADEIIKAFVDGGFELIKDETVVCDHLESDVSMLSSRFRNWFAVFRKRAETPVTISQNTRIRISRKVIYRIDGCLQDGETDSGIGEITVWLEDGDEVLLTELGFDVIKFLNTTRTFGEIIEYVNDLYEIEQQSSIAELVGNLLELKIIRIED